MTAQHPAAPETETDASGLSEAEREALNIAVDEAETCARCGDDYGSRHVYAAVERIVAERLRVVEGERDALRSRVVDAAEDAYEIGLTESLAPTATDALRTWTVRAGFSVRRRNAALAALDDFDAALVGNISEGSRCQRCTESRAIRALLAGGGA